MAWYQHKLNSIIGGQALINNCIDIPVGNLNFLTKEGELAVFSSHIVLIADWKANLLYPKQ
jgi:hypothetical protein